MSADTTCELIIRARTIARGKGLDPNKVVCPMGENCRYLSGGCHQAADLAYEHPNFKSIRIGSAPASPVDPQESLISRIKAHQHLVDNNPSD